MVVKYGSLVYNEDIRDGLVVMQNSVFCKGTVRNDNEDCNYRR